MSKPKLSRKIGERVWVKAGAGFGECHGEWAKIIEEPGGLGCMLCDDPNCNEFANVETEDGTYLFHVSECQMFDREMKK